VRVFVAEATTGAIGKQLVPRLASAGHEVHGMTRSEPKQAMLDELGAEQPMQPPRLAAGEVGAVLMTELRGASNAKAKRELGWQPRQPSWRQGFAT
jgi:nucleoside-diphosphate-sugar epimerase